MTIPLVNQFCCPALWQTESTQRLYLNSKQSSVSVYCLKLYCLVFLGNISNTLTEIAYVPYEQGKNFKTVFNYIFTPWPLSTYYNRNYYILLLVYNLIQAKMNYFILFYSTNALPPLMPFLCLPIKLFILY